MWDSAVKGKVCARFGKIARGVCVCVSQIHITNVGMGVEVALSCQHTLTDLS